MNYKSLRIIISCVLIVSTLHIRGQILPSKAEVDSIFNAKCYKKDYLSASNYIIDCAFKRQDIGDKNTALEYQLKNCYLIEEHFDYFNEKGLTIDEYFTNWEVVSFLYRDLGYMDECFSIYLHIINQMNNFAPDMLTSYSRMIATSFNEYTGEKYRDSVYSLSLAMDYITKCDYTEQDIKDFVWMAYCFNWNRFNNSFKDYVRFSDRVFECDSWFNKYKWFIDCLDKVIFKDEIVKYYVQHTDMLYLLASNLGNHENRYEESISLLNKGISYLDQIKTLNDTIPMKIASYYSEMAKEYHTLGDKLMFKASCDKARDYLSHYVSSENKVNNLDYCATMSQLALNYWYLNQPRVASLLKMIDIYYRKESSRPPKCWDYVELMKYSSGDTISIINIGKELENKYGFSDSSMAYAFLYMADAFSKEMHFAMLHSDEESANRYRGQYEAYIDKAKSVIELFKKYFVENGIIQDLMGFLYDTESAYYARLSKLRESYFYSEKALNSKSTKSYRDIAIKAAALHNKKAIDKYIPLYYDFIISDIKSMLPILGSVESETYLGYGSHPVYRIPEIAQWNPNDSTCASVAYDVSLLIKGLYHNTSSFASVIGNNQLLIDKFNDLKTTRDSIYRIKDENSKTSALYDYEMQERLFRKIIDNEQSYLFFPKWTDIVNCLRDNEIAIEFVCYNKNDYSWINDTICKHYLALIISKKYEYPIVIDLFDETELLGVYEMQPKSYETEEGNKLYKNLWGKLNPYLKNYDNVYFSPIGLLNLINIEALTDEDGVTASNKYSLKRLSSTRQLLSNNKTRTLTDIVLFGAIDYKNSGNNLNFSLDSLNTRGNWAYLSGTKAEIESITKECSLSSSFIINSFMGAQATEDNFKKTVSSNASIIHIATHGFYIPEEKRKNIPYYQNINLTFKLDEELFFSGLVFANGQESWNNSSFQYESNDGILTAYEISRLNLHESNLVILSACETGIGHQSYDGIIGLERGFKMAGANTIIMSLWKVDDIATSFMMENFYKELLESRSIYRSFKYAQEKVREKYPDPYYWASFIMID